MGDVESNSVNVGIAEFILSFIEMSLNIKYNDETGSLGFYLKF